MDLLVNFLRIVYLNNETNWLEVFVTGSFTLFGALFGALVGALLAGWYSIEIVKKQIASDKNSKRTQELQDFIRLVTGFLAYFDYAVSNAEDFQESLNKDVSNNSKLNVSTLDLAKDSIRSFNNAFEEIDKINLSIVPYEYYSNYIVAKMSISDAEIKFNSFVKKFDNSTHESDSKYALKYCEKLKLDINILSTLHEDMLIDYLHAENEERTLFYSN